MKNLSSIKQQISSSAAIETDYHRSYCRRSFYYFVRYFWDTIVADEPVWNWHIKYICDEMQAIGERTFLRSRSTLPDGKPAPKSRLKKEFDYIIMNVPPGSSKSTIASEMYPLWVWANDPTQRFICGSYASTPAEDIAEKCYNIYNSEKFVRLFPELHNRKGSGGKTHFKNGLKGERYTTSTGSAITGIHAHQQIIDDPMNPKIAASKVERETANKWVSETLSSRKVSRDTTVTWIIMQRLHELDTTGYLLKKEGLRIKHICIPAELSEDVKPAALRGYYVNGLFDPIRFSSEALAGDKLTMGSYGYAGQMQQRPSPADGGIIKKHWFGRIARSSYAATSSPIKFQLDTAYTSDTSNDPSAIIAYYKEGQNIYIVNVQSVHKEFPDFVNWLPTFVRNNGYTERSIIRVEPKASGKSIVQQLKATTRLNITEDRSPKEDKLTRLHTASPKIEAGRIILHEGGWNANFIDQVTGFPNAQHDDEVDCLVAIIFNELFGEEAIPVARVAQHFQ